MQKFSRLILGLSLIILGVLCQNPPIWGGSLQYSVNVSFLYNEPVMRWNTTYYYNWNVKS